MVLKRNMANLLRYTFILFTYLFICLFIYFHEHCPGPSTNQDKISVGGLLVKWMKIVFFGVMTTIKGRSFSPE